MASQATNLRWVMVGSSATRNRAEDYGQDRYQGYQWGF